MTTDDKPRWMEFLEKGRELSKQLPAATTLPPPEQHAKAVAKEVQAELFPKGRPPQEQARLPFAPLPSEMARCSPFFPLDKKSLGSRPLLEDFVITRGPWGEIIFTGQKLSTYEESALLAVLALIDGQREKETEQVEGGQANSYSGPILPILKLMGLSDGKANYSRLFSSLELLQGCKVKLSIKGKVRSIGSLVQYVEYDPGTREDVKIVLNPYFRETFSTGRVALLDVIKRAKLSGEVSKALFRFIESHRGCTWEGHLLTLAAALNLDLEQPGFKLREQIKKAIAALVKGCVVGRSSGVRGDIVSLKPPTTAKELPKARKPTASKG